MAKIYFDNSATTKISVAAREKMIEVMDLFYGNPSSLHNMGLEAERIISEARGSVLSTLGIMRGVKGELIFTSGGTESNNIAILGTVFSKKRRGNEVILTTEGEHSSVEKPVSYLEAQGFKVLRVPTLNGKLDLDFIRANARDCILASFMHVNNETGALYDVKSAFDIVREYSPNAVCHSDCVQSYMKVKFTKRSIGADLISISAHKINGAKGVGALYIDPTVIKTKRISPIVFGGGQEEGYRSGTENVYGICTLGVAAREHYSSLERELDSMGELKSYIIAESEKIEGVRVNKPQLSAPHIISITVKGIRSETLLHFLSSKEIYVSSGSACSSHARDSKGSVLTAFGLSQDEADSTVRVSLCPQNTRDEADKLIDALSEAVKRLAKK